MRKNIRACKAIFVVLRLQTDDKKYKKNMSQIFENGLIAYSKHLSFFFVPFFYVIFEATFSSENT